ncbi:large low complexity with coiled coil regions [Cryptosporidium sp. chipmunk genotype I]|uniref:large low complexity with coiled coil regions n=1 Tax=Cryptosporidium sp. chipmunk genotype I TaxID=1280935 RepID=UPI00351A9BE1|nr:large low complexity with coiled coil regions [Cryptosporidium sp. chipmunk genotype I]
MSNNNINNAKSEVFLPLLELNKVKERFKDDNSVQRINELFNYDSLGSSSSSRSSVFSNNLSIPQEPELAIDKSISTNYEDISINQIKNRMLGKHSFSLVSIDWDSDREEKVKHSSSLMSTEDYFNSKIKYNFVIPVTEKKIDIIEKESNSPEISSIRRKSKSSKKMMDKVRSTLQSLIKSHEEENSVTIKSNSHRSNLSSGRKNQEVKLKSIIPKLSLTETSIDDKTFEMTGAKLASLNNSLVSKESRPAFNKKASINKSIMLKGKSFKSQEFEKETKLERINSVQDISLNNKSENLSKESAIEETKGIKLTSKTELNSSDLIVMSEKEMDENIKESTNEIKIQEIKHLEKDNLERVEKLDETQVFSEGPPENDQTNISVSDYKICSDEIKLVKEFKQNYKLMIEDCPSDNKALKNEENIESGIKMNIELLYEKEQGHKSGLSKEKDTGKLEPNQEKIEQKNGTSIDIIPLNRELKCEESKDEKTHEKTEIKNDEHNINNKIMNEKLETGDEKIIDTLEEFRDGNNKNDKLIEANKPTMNNIKDNRENEDEKTSEDRKITNSLESNEENSEDIKKKKDYLNCLNEAIDYTTEQKISNAKEPNFEQDFGLKRDKDQNDQKLIEEKTPNVELKVKDKTTLEESKVQNAIIEIKVKANDASKLDNKSINELNKNNNRREILKTIPSELTLQIESQEVKDEINFQEELKLKVEERENLRKTKTEENEYNISKKLTIENKSKKEVLGQALEDFKQDNKQKSKIIPKYELLETEKNSTDKDEKKVEVETKKNSTINGKISCINVESKEELIKNNKFNDTSNITQKKPVQNQDNNFKKMNIHDELKLLFIAKSQASEQIKHSTNVFELESANFNGFKEENINIPAKINLEENVISKRSINQKKANKDEKLDIIGNKQTDTANTEISQKNDTDNSICPAKKYADQLNKQVPVVKLKLNNSLVTNENKSKIINKNIPQLKEESTNNIKKDSQKKINKTKAANSIDIKSANIKSEISMEIDNQKYTNQLSNKDLKDNDLPRKSEGKDILKGKWNEIIKDKAKIFSCKKRDDQVKKTSNKDISNKTFKEAKNLKNFSSSKDSHFQVNNAIETDREQIVSKASLKKIITLEDCISSEIVHDRSKQNTTNEIIKEYDSSISFKGDKIQKPLLSQRKRILLRCHLTVPKLQYKIYSAASQVNSTNSLIRDETNVLKSENSKVQFSQFRGVFNKLCEIFGSMNEEDSKKCDSLNTEVQRKQSADFELKPFQEKHSLTKKNSNLLIEPRISQRELSSQHDNFLDKGQPSHNKVNYNGSRKLVAIEKLLSSDFSSIEKSNQSYRRLSSSNKFKMENNNSRKLVRRISRKKIANRNIHNILELNKISIKSPRNEDVVNTTNKTLKINLMENILKSEHQIRPMKTLESKKFAKNKGIGLESEIGTSTINKYEDIHMKNRTRRNYFRLLRNYTNAFNIGNYDTGSGCSCHICNKHAINDKMIDPITLHIINEENKLRKMKQNDTTMINSVEKLNSRGNYPKHYHKHYHYNGVRSFKLEKKHRESNCKHKNMGKHKDKYRQDERYHRKKSKKLELKNECDANYTFSENINKHEQHSKKTSNNNNNIYSSNDFAQLKDQIETILREYGVIYRAPKQDMNFNTQNCNISIEPNDISILKNILLDTNKLLSQNILEVKETRSKTIEKNLSYLNSTGKQKNVNFSELEANKWTEKSKISRPYEILTLPSNGLERAIIHRNMMRMKLDLDKIRKDELDRIIDTQMRRKNSKNGQRIAKGRRCIPNISKASNSLENSDPNRLVSLKTVKKTILKSSKQQSDTKNQTGSWFSSWFGNAVPTNEIQESISPIEKNNTDNQETLDKRVEYNGQVQIKKTTVNNNSSPKAKQANSPPPPLAQNHYVVSKSKSTKYFNSSKSDARATKATSNDDESLDINNFVDFSDQDVFEPKNKLEMEKGLEENCVTDAGLVSKPEYETNEQESTFWGWFGYSNTPEYPKTKAKTAKTTQKNITKNNQQRLKRKASNKLPKDDNVENNKEYENSPQIISPPVPAQETSWFSGWFGSGTENPSPPPPPPTPVLKSKDKPKWSPPPPLEPIDNSSDAQAPLENGFGQENDQPFAPPPTPAPAEESSWFSGWFGGTTEPAKVDDSQEKPTAKNVETRKKSSAKSKMIQQNKDTTTSINKLPSIKVSPAPEPAELPPKEDSSWFSGWFGGSETTPAPPPTPIAATNPEPNKIPKEDSKHTHTLSSIPAPPLAPEEESSWFAGWFGGSETTPPTLTPSPTAATNPESTKTSKEVPGQNFNPSNPAPPPPPEEESSWFSSWFGASETTPAPPPTPAAATKSEPRRIPKEVPVHNFVPSSPPPPAEESSWFSGWFGGSETTPAPPPTPAAATNPESTKILEEVPKQNFDPPSPPTLQPSQPQPLPEEDSSWFSGWFGASGTTPAPPPTPIAANSESKKAPKEAPGPNSTPSSPPPPPAEESSWFSGWFGESETTPAPPPTPTTVINPIQNNNSTNSLQVPETSNPTPNSTSPAPAEGSSWFGGWLGGSDPNPPAPPPTPSEAQESNWLSGFGW